MTPQRTPLTLRQAATGALLCFFSAAATAQVSATGLPSFVNCSAQMTERPQMVSRNAFWCAKHQRVIATTGQGAS